VREDTSFYAKCTRRAQTSDLKTGVLGNESLRSVRIAAEVGSGLRESLPKRKFANNTRDCVRDLNQIAHVPISVFRGLLAFVGSTTTGAGRSAFAVLATAAMFYGSVSGTGGRATCHDRGRTEPAPNQAQRKAGHQKPSEVAGYRFHDSSIVHAEKSGHADSITAIRT
jgi:hypothetical protein